MFRMFHIPMYYVDSNFINTLQRNGLQERFMNMLCKITVKFIDANLLKFFNLFDKFYYLL